MSAPRDMEICFLGTGAPWPDPLRGSSAILVDVGSARLLLDCGRACVQQMALADCAGERHAREAEVSRLVLTHLQPDVQEEQLLSDAAKGFRRSLVMATDQMRVRV